MNMIIGAASGEEFEAIITGNPAEGMTRHPVVSMRESTRGGPW
jgi:hypothetical protein